MMSVAHHKYITSQDVCVLCDQRSFNETHITVPGDQPCCSGCAGIVLNVLTAVFGINMRGSGGLLLMAAVFGFGGSIISLLISKWMAKRSYGVQVIEDPRTEMEFCWYRLFVVRPRKPGSVCRRLVSMIPQR